MGELALRRNGGCFVPWLHAENAKYEDYSYRPYPEYENIKNGGSTGSFDNSLAKSGKVIAFFPGYDDTSTYNEGTYKAICIGVGNTQNNFSDRMIPCIMVWLDNKEHKTVKLTGLPIIGLSGTTEETLATLDLTFTLFDIGEPDSTNNGTTPIRRGRVQMEWRITGNFSGWRPRLIPLWIVGGGKYE